MTYSLLCDNDNSLISTLIDNRENKRLKDKK